MGKHFSVRNFHRTIYNLHPYNICSSCRNTEKKLKKKRKRKKITLRNSLIRRNVFLWKKKKKRSKSTTNTIFSFHRAKRLRNGPLPSRVISTFRWLSVPAFIRIRVPCSPIKAKSRVTRSPDRWNVNSSLNMERWKSTDKVYVNPSLPFFINDRRPPLMLEK